MRSIDADLPEPGRSGEPSGDDPRPYGGPLLARVREVARRIVERVRKALEGRSDYPTDPNSEAPPTT